MTVLVLCLESEVSQLFGKSVSYAMRFLGWLGLCVQSGKLLGCDRSQDPEVRALRCHNI